MLNFVPNSVKDWLKGQYKKGELEIKKRKWSNQAQELFISIQNGEIAFQILPIQQLREHEYNFN